MKNRMDEYRISIIAEFVLCTAVMIAIIGLGAFLSYITTAGISFLINHFFKIELEIYSRYLIQLILLIIYLAGIIIYPMINEDIELDEE